MSIQQLSQFNRLKRLGYQQEGEDPAMSLQGIPPPTMDDPYSAGVPNIPPDDPSFIQNDVMGINKQVANAPGDPSENWQKWFEDYQPEHAASDRLNNLVSNPPERVHPGLGRTLVGIAAGLGRGGLKAGQDVMDKPWERAKDEWTTQTGPAYQAASIERQTNANERQLRGTMASNEIQTNKYLEQGRQFDERNATAREKIQSDAEIARRKAQILSDQNNKTKYDLDGQYVMAIPGDGGAPYNTGIPTTAFSPYEIQELRHRSRMAEIEAQGQNAIDTKTAEPGVNPNATNPRDERTETNNKFRVEYETGDRTYIERPKSPNDDWHMKPAPKDPAEYQKWNAVRMRIFPPAQGAGTPKPPPAPPAAPPAGPRPKPSLTGANQGATAPSKDLRAAATKFLQTAKLPVTEANIKHAVETGRVK